MLGTEFALGWLTARGVPANKGRKMNKVILGVVGLAAMAAAMPAQAAVVVGDTFTFSIAGFNSAGTAGYILGTGQTATFGTNQTYVAAGVNGQNYTIASSEVIGATTTTDFFKISTPLNFLTTTTVNGITITQLQLDIGTANSGVGVPTESNPVNFANAITAFTSTGNIVYGTANTVFTLVPTVTLANGGLSFTSAEGVSTGTSAISAFAIHEFNFSITYANPVAAAVPEPAIWAMMLVGFGAIGFGLRSRAKKTARVTHA